MIRNRKKFFQGQGILVIIFISIIIASLGLSITQITIQEAKLVKLEEESKKAFAAAEAALEERLKSNNDITDVNSLSLGEDIVAIDAKAKTELKDTFTIILKKDEQYTFYLSEYNPEEHQITGFPFTGNMKIRLESLDESSGLCEEESKKVLIELTFINKDPDYLQKISKILIDKCSLIEGEGMEWNDDKFYSSPMAGGSHILILRAIAPSSQFSGVKLAIINESGVWPSQGRVIVSSATTKAGVSKKIQLFQSYPQIPADFFVTRF